MFNFTPFLNCNLEQLKTIYLLLQNGGKKNKIKSVERRNKRYLVAEPEQMAREVQNWSLGFFIKR